MDISSYIQDLLWEYECVIIPGFGGILASYRSAEMVLAEHTLYPPTKTLAFNEYLTTNDGLLISHMCQKANLEYTQAAEQVEAWVQKTKMHLANNEEIYLPKIGRLHKDLERNLQFTADSEANYLYSSYGLPKVIAAPVQRDRSEDTIVTRELHRASYSLPRSNKTWALAAMVLLFLAIGSVISLMYQGVNIKPLDLDTSSVLGFVENVDKHSDIVPEMKVSINREVPKLQLGATVVPQPVAPAPDATASIETAPAPRYLTATKKPEPTIDEIKLYPAGSRFYVIIGAYKNPEHLYNAETNFGQMYPNETQFEDTAGAVIRIGFYAGDSYDAAAQKLQEAKLRDHGSWLLVRK